MEQKIKTKSDDVIIMDPETALEKILSRLRNIRLDYSDRVDHYSKKLSILDGEYIERASDPAKEPISVLDKLSSELYELEYIRSVMSELNERLDKIV